MHNRHAVFLASALAMAVASPSHGQEVAPSAGYEYRILQSDALPNEQNLDDLDAQGWELVQIVEWGGLLYIYLRRPRRPETG